MLKLTPRLQFSWSLTLVVSWYFLSQPISLILRNFCPKLTCWKWFNYLKLILGPPYRLTPRNLENLKENYLYLHVANCFEKKPLEQKHSLGNLVINCLASHGNLVIGHLHLEFTWPIPPLNKELESCWYQKIDRAHQNYRAYQIKEQNHLRQIFYGSLIFSIEMKSHDLLKQMAYWLASHSGAETY